MYESTVKKAKKLRDWYKANLKLTRNDVSVKKLHEGCLQIEMKNPNLPIETKDRIYKAAKGYEDISRDEHTGEILLGGNDYTFVYGPDGMIYWPSTK